MDNTRRIETGLTGLAAACHVRKQNDFPVRGLVPRALNPFLRSLTLLPL